jgi:hypothetical protein
VLEGDSLEAEISTYFFAAEGEGDGDDDDDRRIFHELKPCLRSV